MAVCVNVILKEIFTSSKHKLLLLLLYHCIQTFQVYCCVYREELSRQTTHTETYFAKMKDLKIMLESSRARVKVGS